MNDNQVDDGRTLLVVDGITSDYYRGGPEVARPLIQDLADDGDHGFHSGSGDYRCGCHPRCSGLRWSDVMSYHPEHDRALTSAGIR